MTAKDLYDRLLEIRVKSSRDLNKLRVDLCLRQREYVPITAIHLSQERIKINSSCKYKSMDALQVFSTLHDILLKNSNHKREVFMIWKGGTEWEPNNVYLNKKGIVILMK